MADFQHAILFTGHMIDARGRKSPRFPPSATPAVHKAIEDSVAALLARHAKADTTVGIAGGASGGDILFHEACAAQSIPTLLYLALPLDEYLKVSVAPAGPEWVQRFNALVQRLGPASIRVLDDTIALPQSMTAGAELNIWQRVNLWMVQQAIELAPQRTLLALWDGKAGDGLGGTEDLVKTAPASGIDLAPVIRMQSLFE